MLIRVVPVGNPPEKILEILCSQLERLLRLKCRLLGRIDIPQDAHNHWRKQYNAEMIMQDVSNIPEVKFIDKEVPTLMITDQDIYFKGLNFVFGVEDPVNSCCIVSLARLRPEFYDQRPDEGLVTERLIKKAMHEIGHLKGLDHCPLRTCIMSYSPSVADIDTKKKEYCNSCKVKIMTKGINL